MADEGPTTVGSIDGRLTLNIEDWKAKVAIIKADAAELAGTSPDVKVTADTASAQASMAAVDAAAATMGATATTAGQRVKQSADEVAAAEAKLAAANSAADLAYAKVALSQQRLNELQEQGRTKASTLMAAEIALTEAMKRLDAANEKATLSEAALAEAQERAANAAIKQAAAEAAAGKVSRDAGNNAASGASRVQLIIAGVVALIALAAPLGAAAIAIGGALAGMGAAGVLAVMGVVAAIKAGNTAGQQWSDGLHALKGDLDKLSATSAAAVLGDFQQAVQLINQSMPELDGEVRLFSQSLGTVLVNGLRGVITAFQILNPLFMQGVGVVERLAAGFVSWTQSGGLQQFASYAQAELPTVVSTIGHLAEAVINVVVALAPLGSSILTVVDGVSGLLSWLSQLGPTLSIVTGAVLAGFAAFKLWGLIGPILATAITWMEGATGAATALGVAVDAAMGPIGWVAAGVTALAAAVGIGASAMNQGTTAATDYTAALTASNGAIDQNVRNLTAKALVDAGGVTAANQLGIATSQVTDAILNQNGARKDLISQLQDEVTAGTSTIGMGRSMHVVHDDNARAAQKLLDIINPLASSFDAEAGAVRETNAAASSTTVTMQDLSSATAAVTTAVDNAAKAMQGFGSANMSVDQASIAFQQSLDQVTASVKQNGEGVEGNSKAALANRSALIQVAQAADTLISKQAQQGASEKTLQANMAQSRADFIKAAEAAGATAKEAENLANRYGLIPKNVETAFKDAGYQAAIDHAYAVKLALGQIPRQIWVHYNSTGDIGIAGPGGKVIAHATGGTIHGPGSRTADRVIAALSDSEEVISNDRGQADRWRGMLKLINANAPAGQIASSAMRGAGVTATSSTARQAAPTTIVNLHYTVQNPVSRDPVADTRDASQALATALALGGATTIGD